MISGDANGEQSFKNVLFLQNMHKEYGAEPLIFKPILP